MLTVYVKIDSAEKVKRLTSVLSKVGADCEIVQGVRIIDAKSIMGIFSLDLALPVQLRIHSDDRAVLEQLKDFLTEEVSGGPGAGG